MRPAKGNRIGMPLRDGRVLPERNSGSCQSSSNGLPLTSGANEKQLKPRAGAIEAVEPVVMSVSVINWDMKTPWLRHIHDGVHRSDWARRLLLFGPHAAEN